MTLSVNWYDEEHTIAYVHFTPGWNWEDFWAMNDSFNKLAETVHHHIVLIVDMTGAGMPTQFVPELSKIAVTSSERPKHLDLTIVVGLGVMLETVTNIFTRLYRRATEHVRFVPTLSDALEIVRLRRQTPLTPPEQF